MEHDTTTRHTDTGEAADAARALKDDAAAKAKELGNAAADEVRTRAEGAKSGVADEISNIGSALRKASSEMRDGSPQERTFGYMANALADLSDTVRGKDFGDMIDDLGDFARRNPLAFLGGAALLGFAGVRMARASKQSPRDADYRESSAVYPSASARSAQYATAGSTPTNRTGGGRSHEAPVPPGFDAPKDPVAMQYEDKRS